MTEIGMTLKKKKERIDISSLSDLKKILKRDGYIVNKLDEDEFKEEMKRIFNINEEMVENLYTIIEEDNIIYRSKDILEFIDYIEKVVLFEKEHNKLCKKISKFKKVNITRVEYDRVVSIQDDVEHIIKAINKIKDSISETINEKEIARIETLEAEISKEYVYAKDIELLKKMILNSAKKIKEKSDDKNKIKTISMEIPTEIKTTYIKPTKGTIEYYQHLKNNIPRMKRLRKNIDKYIEFSENEVGTISINQSDALQDSINIAVAIYNGKEFKAVSGSDEVEGFCMAKPIGQVAFKSSKVNKLGKLGIGYNRINDSEKKILEEINKQIESNELEDKGELVLYSKWQPCPSCYYVISQFCEKYPRIKFKVKYRNKYGE